MPKVNVYLPDDLAAAVRRAELPVSAICQQALAEAVRTAAAAREAIGALRDPAAAAPELMTATPRLRRVLERAGERAGPGQLLLALLDEDDNLALRILALLDVDVSVLRAAATGAEPGGAAAGRSVVAAALEAAVGLGHGYLGTEHLLLGLAAVAGDLVGAHGVTPERVRRAIPAAVGTAALGYREALPGDRLDAIERRLAALERHVLA